MNVTIEQLERKLKELEGEEYKLGYKKACYKSGKNWFYSTRCDGWISDLIDDAKHYDTGEIFELLDKRIVFSNYSCCDTLHLVRINTSDYERYNREARTQTERRGRSGI